MQAHILDRVKLPLSYGINPGCEYIIWYTPTHCPGFVRLSFLSSDFLPWFEDFARLFVRCCAPNMQGAHGGGRSLSRRKCFGRSLAFDSQNIIDYGRWNSWLCMSISSCSAGFKDLGLRIDAISQSLICLAISWTLVKVVGSDGTSGLCGRLRYSRGIFSLVPVQNSILYSNIPFVFSPLSMILMTALWPWFL